MVNTIKVSKEAAKEIIVVDPDNIIYIDKMKPVKGGVMAELGHSDVVFHRDGAAVLKFTGEHEEKNIVSKTECVGKNYTVYSYGPDRPELLPIAVRIDEKGKARFGIIANEEYRNPKAEHGTIKPDIALHIPLDRHGFFDVEGAKKLLVLIQNGGTKIKEWEVKFDKPEEAEKRLRQTLQAIIDDHTEIAIEAKFAAKFWDATKNPEITKLLPDEMEDLRELAQKYMHK